MCRVSFNKLVSSRPKLGGFLFGVTALKIITESTDEPISLDEAAENLRVVDPSGNSPPVYQESARILKLIKAARQACEEELEMSLVEKTIEVTQQSFYPRCIELPAGPVRGIESVTYVDTNGDDQVLAEDQYRLSTSGRTAILWPAYNVTWPSARCETDSVRVRYIAGYPADSPPEAIPEPILQAMHLMIAHYFANREAVDQDNLMELPMGTRYLLDKYRQGLGV